MRHLKAFEEKGPEVQREAEAARKLINAIIDDPSTPSDNVALTRIDERIDTAVNDLRHRLAIGSSLPSPIAESA